MPKPEVVGADAGEETERRAAGGGEGGGASICDSDVITNDFETGKKKLR